MNFLHILLAIQPAIAAYKHHINTSIYCPVVVSVCPFKPPPTHNSLFNSNSYWTFIALNIPMFTLLDQYTISIPPLLPTFQLFILLLLSRDINPNPDPVKFLMQILYQYPANTLAFQNVSLTMT